MRKKNQQINENDLYDAVQRLSREVTRLKDELNQYKKVNGRAVNELYRLIKGGRTMMDFWRREMKESLDEGEQQRADIDQQLTAYRALLNSPLWKDFNGKNCGRCI